MNKQPNAKSVIKRGLRSLRVFGPSITAKKILCRFGQTLANKYEGISNTIYEEKRSNSSADARCKTSEDVKIGFCIAGGMGDKLIAINYIYSLKKRFADKNLVFDIYFNGGEIFENMLLDSDVRFWGRHGSYNVKVVDSYDWFVLVEHYPFQLKSPSSRLKEMFPKFYEYTELCREFKKEHRNYLDQRPLFDGVSNMLEAMHNRRRLQQADIYGFLGMGTDFEYHVSCHPNDTLQKFGIDRPFITVHRGSDTAFSSNVTKLLPLEKYNQIISFIKAEWSDKILIVQVGVSEERCPAMKGVDINLVGKTSISQVRDLIGSSLLHIDGEGGFVHLRSSIDSSKPSIVFYGPTHKDFYAYDGNVNIVGTSCNGGVGCEWLSVDWLDKCILGNSASPCMQSIDVSETFPQIREILKRYFKAK